jgi:Heparinase II/III-like protein
MNLSGPARIAAVRPRLMATKSAIERTQRLLQQNATARQWQRKVAEQADLLLSLPPLTQDWVHDPRETSAAPLPLVRPPASSDGPAAPLDIARLFCLRIQTLGITWLLTLDSRYRDRAKAELLAVCDFPDWAGDKFLVTAETAFGAAIGYDWLYEILSDGERAHISHAIIGKAIRPGLGQFATPAPPYWTRTPMNWNLVCNGALMIAALSVWESDPQAANLFALCRASISIGFGAYGPDGGWAEGPGYWHYASQYAIYVLDGLSTALGTDLGFGTSEGLSKTGLFRLHAAGPSGKLFNFADGTEEHSGGYWLFWLARRYHHPIDAAIERHVRKVHPIDLLWFDDNDRDPTRLPVGRRFHATDVVTLRGNWADLKTTYLGIRGGANDACEHGHYDLGSFVLDSLGVRWAMDLGPDDYNLPGYFKPEMRTRYYRTSTIGHNTIVIDGECQPATARAAIVRTSFGEKLSCVVMDLSAAYPATVSALRGFALINRRDVLIVDEIVPKKCLSSLDWQMHTQAHVAIFAASALLTGDGPEPPCFHLRITDPDPETWSLGPTAPAEPPGQDANAGVAKLVLHLDQVVQPVRLAVLLSPDADACSAPRLPLALRRPLAAWIRPGGARYRRAANS